MKKIILLIFLFLININVYASTCVVDTDTKRVLYENGGKEEKLIASTTKIMTSLIVLNYVDNLDEIIEVDESILTSTGSGIYIEVGEHISIRNLLYGLMLRSGNDAAIMLANYVGGSMEGFAYLMNEYAKNIGMEDTNFINSSGLENDEGIGNTSTCIDMAILMSEATKSDTLMEIMSTKNIMVKTDYKTYDWYNKNKLLTNYKYTTGGKTGYTKKAYRTLVTSASKDNKNLAVVTLDEANDFATHEYLYETYFNKYKIVNILDKNTYLKNESKYISESFDMLLTEDEIDLVKIENHYISDVRDRLGYVTVSIDGVEYFRTYIYENNNTSILYRIISLFKNIF